MNTEMKQHDKLSAKRLISRLIFNLIGAAFVSVGIEMFLVPNDIIDGGLTGISILLSHFIHFPLALFLVILNAPFLFIGYRQIGKTFTFMTLFAVVMMSLGTLLLKPVSPITKDPLLVAVFGGIILGIGVGIVIRNGGSLDGADIAAILFNKNTAFSVGEIAMFFNIFILGSAGFVFGWDHAMYSLITYFIAFKMIDITIEGLNESKAVWIISDEVSDIGKAIMDRLDRGVTYLHGEGGFTGENKEVMYCVITRLEEAKLKSIVEEFDPEAFLAIGSIHEVKGGRFKKRSIH